MATPPMAKKQVRECLRILSCLGGDNKKASQNFFQNWSWPFWSPVEEVIRQFPAYADVVKEPMDLARIKKNVSDKRYESHREFARDVRLVFANAKLFNAKDKDTKGGVYQGAEHCEKQFDTEYEKMLASQEVSPVPSHRPQQVTTKLKVKLPKQHAAAVAPRHTQFDAAECRKRMDSLLTKYKQAKDHLWAYQRAQLLQLPNYQIVVTDPIAGPDIDQNLESGVYSDLAAFCGDVRLFLTNTMRFNLQDAGKQGIFKMAHDFLQKFESSIGRRAWPGVPHKQRTACNTVLLSLMKHKQDAIYPFLFPMAIYMQAKADLAAYNDVVERPVDIGMICAALNLGKYTSVDQFYDDVERAFSNCELYWQQPTRREHGGQYCKDAVALRTYFKAECDKQRKAGNLPALSLGSLAAESIKVSVAAAPASSSASASSVAMTSTGASSSSKIPGKAPGKGYGRKRKVQSVSAHCLEATKQLKKCSQLFIFLKPVDQEQFTTYKDHVSQPMDLGTVEKCARQGHYNEAGEGLGVEKFAADLQLISDNCRSFAKTLTEIDRAAMYQCAQEMETRAQEQLVNVRKKIHDDAEYKKAEDAERLEQERQRELEQQQRQHYKGRKLTDNELRMLDILDRFAADKCVTEYHFDIPLDKRRLEDAHRKQLKQKIEIPMDLDKIRLKIKRGDYRGPTPFLNFMKDVTLITDNAKKLFDDPNKPNEITLREVAVHVDRMFQNFCVDMIPPPPKSDKQLFERHRTWAASVVDERQRVVLQGKMRKKHCQQVLKVLTADEKCCATFGPPVDDARLFGEEFVRQYKAKIKQPMCLEHVKSKLKKDSYDTMRAFYEDVHRIFDNALLFNKGTNQGVCDDAQKYKAIFESKWQADSIHALNVIGRQTAESAVDAKEREKQRKAREKRQAEEEEHEQELRRIKMEAQRRDEAVAEEAALHKKQKQVRAQRIAAPTVFKDPAREREERKRAEKEKKQNQEKLKVLCASAILHAAEQVEKSHRLLKRSADAAPLHHKPQTKARAVGGLRWENIQNNAKDTRHQQCRVRMNLVSSRKRHRPLSHDVFGDELDVPGAPPIKMSGDLTSPSSLLPHGEDATAPSSQQPCFRPGLCATVHKLFGRCGQEGWKSVAPANALALDVPGGIATPGFQAFDAGGGVRVEALANVIDHPLAVNGCHSPFSSGLLHLSIALSLPLETTAATDGTGVGVVTVQPSTALAPRELHFLESLCICSKMQSTAGALLGDAAMRCPETCSLLQRFPLFAWHRCGVFVSTVKTWSRAKDRCAQLHVIGVPGCFRVAVDGVYCCNDCGGASAAMDVTQ